MTSDSKSESKPESEPVITKPEITAEYLSALMSKVKRLIALGGGATEGGEEEARSAARQACKLIAEHELALAPSADAVKKTTGEGGPTPWEQVGITPMEMWAALKGYAPPATADELLAAALEENARKQLEREARERLRQQFEAQQRLLINSIDSSTFKSLQSLCTSLSLGISIEVVERYGRHQSFNLTMPSGNGEYGSPETSLSDIFFLVQEHNRDETLAQFKKFIDAIDDLNNDETPDSLRTIRASLQAKIDEQDARLRKLEEETRKRLEAHEDPLHAAKRLPEFKNGVE